MRIKITPTKSELEEEPTIQVYLKQIGTVVDICVVDSSGKNEMRLGTIEIFNRKIMLRRAERAIPLLDVHPDGKFGTWTQKGDLIDYDKGDCEKYFEGLEQMKRDGIIN